MILLNLTYIFNLILLSYFIKLLFISFVSKTTDIIQYKIIDKKLTTIILLVYISLLIIGLYIYRIFRIGNTLDLKFLYYKYNTFIILQIPMVHKFYFILQGVLIFLLFMLLILNIHKYAFLEIFKVYIYINYSRFLGNNQYTKNLYDNLQFFIGHKNIIAFFLDKITHLIVSFLKDLEINHGTTYKEFEFPKYNFSTVIYYITNHRFWGFKHTYTFDIFLYYFLPMVLITYECIFHNYELTFIFYYLPFIVPIMLLQKITKTISKTDGTISDLIWEMYYKKESCIYACTGEQKVLLDVYLRHGLQLLPGLDLVFLSENLSVLNNSPLHFKPIMEERNFNMYQNDFGDCAQKLPNGDFVIVTDYLFEDHIKKYGSDEKPFITYGEHLILLLEK